MRPASNAGRLQRCLFIVAQHPGAMAFSSLLVLLLCLGIVIAPGHENAGLKIDPSVAGLLPQDDRDRAVFERVQEQFGDTDAVIVAVRYPQVFDVQTFSRIEALSRALRKLDGVRHVFSLATAPNLIADGDLIDVSSFTQQARAAPARIAAMAGQIKANPLYAGSLVSADGRSASFALSLSEMSATEFREYDYPGRIRDLVEQIGGAEAVWITGSPVVEAATTQALFKTLRLILPAIFVLVIALLAVAFRSARATLCASLTIAAGLLWTLADFAILDIPINMVTAIVPPLLITLGLAYSVHLLSEFFDPDAPTNESPQQAVLRTWQRSGPPLLLTGATTVAGLLALLINPLPAVRQFAVLSSLGVAATVGFVLLLLPSLLVLCRCRSHRATSVRWFAGIADKLAAFDTQHRRHIAVVAIVGVLVAIWSASDIRVGTEYIRSFSPQSTVRVDFEAINEQFGGATLVSILIETHVDDALTNPELMAELENFQQWLKQQPEVGAAVSYIDHLKLINQNLNEGEAAYFRIPETASAAKQLLVYGGSEEIHRVIDSRFRTALLNARINVDGSISIGEFVRRVEEKMQALPPPLFASITGSPVLATRAVDDIASGQFVSIALALFVIYLLLALLFTSASAGLVAMLPNVLPIAAYFGLLGAFDVTLNPTTSLIACIVLGVAVDDTIHFLARFNADARAQASESEAVKSALRTTLRPVTLTTVALCLGFAAFSGSELQNQVEFGLLASATLLLAWVVDITVTPALGSTVRIVTLWDLLRLDLGQSPQHTIPLLSGLTMRQARTFALLSNIEKVEAGSRVITEGDTARDIYVVVDGKLQAWVQRNEERRALSTMGRGATMGEAGYFGQKRTANVDALTKVRLLRFDSQDLERLRLRHPRIAAVIFRNLNRIQAERIARTTAMLQ